MFKTKLKLMKGDITQLSVDAIVNAANTTLLGGGGVDGAIHLAAGSQLREECRKLDGCPTGQAKITAGYNLLAKYVIHTVGPVWRGGAKGEPKLLASCYQSSLRLANDNQIKTIAFPAVSCGIYGYPASQAALIAIKETASFIGTQENNAIEEVIFVCFDDPVLEAYQFAIDSLAQ